MDKTLKRKLRKKLGGPRPGAGRKPKADKDSYAMLRAVLRRETIEKLHRGAGSRWVGEFLQRHLDRYPLPTHEEDQAMRRGHPAIKVIKRRKVPVVISVGRVRKVRRPKPLTPQREILRRFKEA